MKPGESADRRARQGGESSGPTIERLLRIAAALVDMPIAYAFAVEGDRAWVLASVCERGRENAVRGPISAHHLRLGRVRVVPHVAEGATAPEAALFAARTTVRALVSLPLVRDGVQVGAVVLADLEPRGDLGARRIEALREVCAIMEWALRSRPAPGHQTAVEAGRDTVPRRARPLSRPALHRDPVTGLVEHASVQSEIERRVERARFRGHGVAVVLVSLDRFRRVNESLGYALGDRLLRQVAQRLLESVDDIDVVARWSGDEFLVLFDEIGLRRPSQLLVDRIHRALREPFHLNQHEIVLTACFGIARYPDDASDASTLLRYADIALNRAKSEGAGQLRVFDASMRTLAGERLELEHQLREAMRAGQLSLHYQPKYAIPARRLVGAEALLRWFHPQRGEIPAWRVVAVAEESGLIVPIETWVLHEACRQTRRWVEAGLHVGRISVNVSGSQFAGPDFVGIVRRALDATGLGAEYLEIELTERIVVRDVDTAIARLNELRSMGVRVAIDDFGTGYSSLAYLQALPVDVLKIDRSFVQGLDRQGTSAERACSLVRAMTYLGHQLGLRVLAEGVETEVQLDRLEEAGCDEVQGFLLGRPMPAQAFERHVRVSGA
jgi:diguanylate cyclase (GGDEF)-like protein